MLEKHMYCMKCHGEKTVVGQSPVMFKNGSMAMKGHCPRCQSTAYKIVSKEKIRKQREDQRKAQAFGLLAFSLGVVVGLAVMLVI